MDSVSKNDIIAELEKLNIEHKVSSKKDELYALLPDAVRAEIEAREKADKEAEEKKDEPVVEKKELKTFVVANIIDKEGRFVRAYSEVNHGEDFEKLANEFVGDRPGYTVRMGQVSEKPEVVVPVKEKGVTAVVRKGVNVVRTFTKAIHGEDFAVIAEEFAGRRGMSVRVE